MSVNLGRTAILDSLFANQKAARKGRKKWIQKNLGFEIELQKNKKITPNKTFGNETPPQ